MSDALQLIEVVAEDLRFLRTEWDQSIDDHSLRRTSPVLRRLLVHNDLQNAWKAAGFEKEPRITVPTLASILEEFPLSKIVFAPAGGAVYDGARISHGVWIDECLSDEEIAAGCSRDTPDETLGLRAFVENPCLAILGQLIPRRAVIKFIANKLGGDHFDASRRDTPEEQMFSLLDEARVRVQLGGKSNVYFELLAAGQALTRSADVTAFCERAEGLLQSVILLQRARSGDSS